MWFDNSNVTASYHVAFTACNLEQLRIIHPHWMVTTTPILGGTHYTHVGWWPLHPYRMVTTTPLLDGDHYTHIGWWPLHPYRMVTTTPLLDGDHYTPIGWWPLHPYWVVTTTPVWIILQYNKHIWLNIPMLLHVTNTAIAACIFTGNIIILVTILE